MALAVALPAAAYDYPFDDPFVATVVGTPAEYRADLPERWPRKWRRTVIFEDREPPDFLFYERKYRYSWILQRGPAPLVFLIAGTGGSHNGPGNTTAGKALYQAGFHVVGLSSPTHSNFIATASSTSVPGHAETDAEDLYRVMEIIRDELPRRVEVTDYAVAGYSLGAFNAAFVAKLDEERQSFNFKRVGLINPPLRLYSSISLLDRMLDNMPGGIDNFPRFWGELITAFSEVYKRSDSLDFSEDFLYKAYEIFKPSDEELGALIGVSFRLASSNLVTVSDVMTDFGFVKPPNLVMGRNSSADWLAATSTRVGFTDYFHAYFYPYHRNLDPSVTRASLINQMSLRTIEDYLRSSNKIYLMHNRDDLILEPGEIDYFPEVFGDRARIYPNGGHLGNMAQRDFVDHFVKVMRP